MEPLQLDKLSGLELNSDIELQAHIGTGGMGVVYRGLQKSLHREVCVKFMHSDLVSAYEWQTRFRREAMALARPLWWTNDIPSQS